MTVGSFSTVSPANPVGAVGLAPTPAVSSASVSETPKSFTASYFILYTLPVSIKGVVSLVANIYVEDVLS